MGQYDDILYLPHHVSKKRAPMSMIDRGAQFSPFAALTGYDAVIRESTRITQDGVDLAEGEIQALDEILQDLRDRIREHPEAIYTCFVPDQKKAGGAYVKRRGRLQKYDPMNNSLEFTDGEKIGIGTIVAIERV